MSSNASAAASLEQAQIRVLVISHSSRLNGAQLSLLDLLSHIDRDRYQPIVVANGEGPLIDKLRAMGVTVLVRDIVHWVSLGRRRALSYPFRLFTFARGLGDRVRAIAQVIEQHRIDLVYTNTVTVIEGALAARKTGKPHVWHLRERLVGNEDLSRLFPSSLVKQLIARLSSLVVVNSEYTAREYDCASMRSKLRVVHNGVSMQDPARDVRQYQNLREELGLPTGTRLVTLVGMLNARKGLPLFIRAAQIINTQFANAAFLLAGNGSPDYVRQLQQLVAALGLTESFRFLGWRPDVPRILWASDVMVVAAEQEPFGRTVVEAMAAGIPVVSTRCGGPEEIIQDGMSGILVPRGHASAIAEATLRLLRDPELARRVGNAGRARAQELFSLSAYVSKIEGVLLAAAKAPSGTAHAAGGAARLQ